MMTKGVGGSDGVVDCDIIMMRAVQMNGTVCNREGRKETGRKRLKLTWCG